MRKFYRNYTPKPWINAGRISDNNSNLLVYASEEESHLTIEISCDDPIEEKANACLVSLAPDLFEALINLRLEAQHLLNTGVGRSHLQDSIARANLLIEKIESI